MKLFSLCGVSDILFKSDLAMTRVSLAIGELFWAIMLFWPGDTFVRPTYDVMSHVANESVWTVLFFLSGCVQLHIASEKRTGMFERVFSGLNSLLWTSVVIMMLFSVFPPPAATGMEFAAAMVSIWIFTRPIVLKNMENKVAKSRYIHLHTPV